MKPFRQAQGPESIEGLAGIFSLASGGLEDYATGTLHQHESILFRSLWERLEKGDLVLGDRGFCSYAALARLSQCGIDSVLRLHQARKVSFREGKRLGKDDRLITWQKPAQRTDAWTHEEWEALPAELSLRLIRCHVSTPGFRTRSVTLVTTLTDAGTYPADKIRALYGQRWEVELHFHQIKILLGLDPFDFAQGRPSCVAKARNSSKRKPSCTSSPIT